MREKLRQFLLLNVDLDALKSFLLCFCCCCFSLKLPQFPWLCYSNVSCMSIKPGAFFNWQVLLHIDMACQINGSWLCLGMI